MAGDDMTALEAWRQMDSRACDALPSQRAMAESKRAQRNWLGLENYTQGNRMSFNH